MVCWFAPTVVCGLENVTVAPGSTAPDESVTVPAIAPTPCAPAVDAMHTIANTARTEVPAK